MMGWPHSTMAPMVALIIPGIFVTQPTVGRREQDFMDAGCSIISSISPTPSSVIGRGHVLTSPTL